jgi:hypothetical protein
MGANVHFAGLPAATVPELGVAATAAVAVKDSTIAVTDPAVSTGHALHNRISHSLRASIPRDLVPSPRILGSARPGGQCEIPSDGGATGVE